VCMVKELSFPTAGEIARLRLHIQNKWDGLTRSLVNAVEAARDPKLEETGRKYSLYIAASEKADRVRTKLEKLLDPADFEMLNIRALPADHNKITEHGLLYLPGRYVVPGGRFNEIYGWDSYFIVIGLLHTGRQALARSMADQLLYQVNHYGTVLTANRTYYLTRSHPPLLGRMVLAVFEATGDIKWLERALPLLEKLYFYWVVPPHGLPSMPLSRYHDFGHGPAPEVSSGEHDEQGRGHYERLEIWFREHPSPSNAEFCDPVTGKLTDAAYRGDRAMRESGFDPSWRFGPANLDIAGHAPVCLNTLLWRLETDIAQIREILDANATVQVWRDRAAQRFSVLRDLLWDESDGLFYDYHPGRGSRVRYPFATTFWPLWAGVATADQARRVVANLPMFEAPGGLMTSTHESGCQWDAPFSWAPLVYMAVAGLTRYGYGQEARRLARKFISVVAQEFQRTGNIYEKYDAQLCTSDVSGRVKFGYPSNEPGFGWTNACAHELMSFLGSLGHGAYAASV
jgi:alpha,alpha-trehalase